MKTRHIKARGRQTQRETVVGMRKFRERERDIKGHSKREIVM